MLWSRDHEHLAELESQHVNRRISRRFHLPDCLQADISLGAAVEFAELALVAVPTHGFT